MKKTYKARCLFVALVMVLTISMCSVGFASGVETLPLDTWYFVGSFSFTGYNITPVKTVEGRYLTIYVDFYKPSWDSGTGGVKLEIAIKDYYTGSLITNFVSMGTSTGNTVSNSTTFDLGYSGRKVHIYFKEKSADGSSSISR